MYFFILDVREGTGLGYLYFTVFRMSEKNGKTRALYACSVSQKSRNSNFKGKYFVSVERE
jgi:hypothetical protein